MTDKVSQQSHDEALMVAKNIQKPKQSKEQTKLIVAGIEKGIAVYKKQHKAKLREQDKQRKKSKRVQDNTLSCVESHNVTDMDTSTANRKLPWVLLATSWIGFVSYIVVGYA